MSLPYRYELMIRVEIAGEGIQSDGDGAKATANRLAALLVNDPSVVKASAWPDIVYLGKPPQIIKADHWPDIEYRGKRLPPEPEPQGGDERVEPWGSGQPGTATHTITLRYSAKYEDWFAVGEMRESAWDGNAAVRYDNETTQRANVPICDALGGHVGWVSWEEWSSWPIIRAEDEEVGP